MNAKSLQWFPIGFVSFFTISDIQREIYLDWWRWWLFLLSDAKSSLNSFGLLQIHVPCWEGTLRRYTFEVQSNNSKTSGLIKRQRQAHKGQLMVYMAERELLLSQAMSQRNWSHSLWHQTFHYFQKTQFKSFLNILQFMFILIEYSDSNIINDIQYISLLTENEYHMECDYNI